MMQGNYDKCRYRCNCFSISFFKSFIYIESVKDIIKAAGWASDSSFPRIYHQPDDKYFGNCNIEFYEQINSIVWVIIFLTANLIVYETVI